MPFLFNLQFTTFSALWLFVSLATGLGYAFFLYQKNSELRSVIKHSLFALRTLAVSSIVFLLFAPFVKFTKTTVEKPLIVVLSDNSASIPASQPQGFNLSKYDEAFSKLTTDLTERHDVRTLRFGSKISVNTPATYQDRASNISAAFHYVNQQFSNRNIGAVILASDGIYNRGGNPQYEAMNVKAPVYAIALGDTIPKRDLLIANVNYNSIVYLGNDFQIEIEIEAFQSKGASSRLSVTGKSGTVFSKSITINSPTYRSTVPVNLSANEKGIQKFTATFAPLEGELSTENNIQTFFVEVLDGRQNVFILAQAPHPDIGALKQSIESNKNYQVKVGFANLFNQEDLAKSNLVIAHQLPSHVLSGTGLSSLTANKNVWYILGSQSELSSFSSAQNLLQVSSSTGIQEVFAQVNDDFFEFDLSTATKTKIQNFGPLMAPFSNYTLKGQTFTLLKQNIGRVSSERPLLLVTKDSSRRTAVLAAEGIWRWRMEDFRKNNSHKAVDELLSKTVQYLSSKEDKRRFRVSTAKNMFDESEQVLFNAELYNDAYQLINTPDASITLKNNQNKTYPFLFSRSDNSYVLNAGVLPSGEYTYLASTQLAKNKYTATGKFLVNRQQEEYRHTTANHQLLFALANESGGKMIFPQQLSDLKDLITRNELIKSISYEDDRFEELVNVKWIFGVILILLSLEWFNRKRNGEL